MFIGDFNMNLFKFFDNLNSLNKDLIKFME